ncbi:MAG TPA: amidohydrolase family protein [Sphingomonas sp.]|nr:amidohydrolase family protein [Sphingomonas sp.]
MTETATLFSNVNILDGTGAQPFRGDVLVRGNRIEKIARAEQGALPREAADAVVDGGGSATLMPGLCDAHTHMTWTNGDSLHATTAMPIEEHLLLTIDNARTYLDCGFTMCVGAASAKPRLDVVIRDAVNSGRIPGPRMLASGMEIATTGADVNPSLTADGVDEIRKTVRQVCKLGVNTIKLSLSGEQITGSALNHETFFTDDEVAVAVEEATRRGVRVAAHARNETSIKMCVRHGVNIIYHASFTDEETLDMLEAAKDRVFVAPGFAWLVMTCYHAADWGVSPEAARKMGYYHELECAIESMKKMHKRGIRVLPGGDYGFAWTPHGTYAKDFEYFVDLLGFSPMETIVAATRLGGEIMGDPNNLGLVQEGYLADLLLLDGDPLRDITMLQDRDNLLAIMKDGSFHKAPAAIARRPAAEPAREPVGFVAA